MKSWLVVLACGFLLAACTQQSTDQSVAGQIKGNQALVLQLANENDLTDLYFSWLGNSTKDKIVNGQLVTTRDTGTVEIGELNLVMHNIGGSVTAGGLYVSGYDPNLINVSSVLGEDPIQDSVWRNCYRYIGVSSTGSYNAEMYCDSPGPGLSFGGVVSGNANNPDDFNTIMGTLGGIPVGTTMDWIANKLQYLIPGPNTNVDFFSKIGLFNDIHVSCGEQSGKPFCNYNFGGTQFNPNRATYGYILLNLIGDQIMQCPNHCRPFPPQFRSGDVVHGVSIDYPQGDVRYANYVIKLNKGAWNDQLNDLKQTFQVTACYAYSTVVTPTVCVDPDPVTYKGEPCRPGPIVFNDGQGAPVKVTKITEDSRPGYAAFTIYVQNVGNGQVWLPGAFDQCSPWSTARPDPRKMDGVVLLDARVSGDLQQMQCLGAEYNPDEKDNAAYMRMVRLQNGQGQITCLYPLSSLSGHSAYQTSLTLEFGYIYSNSVSKQVVIHRT